MGMLDAALAYAARGWAVFPVWPPTPEGGCTCGDPDCTDQGKHPVGVLAPHGLRDATTDPATITRWWSRQPEANIGVAAGKSGLCVIDIDVRDDIDGFATWQTLKARHGIDDETVTAITGGGGWHLFYTAPADLHPRAKLGPGIDIKANGGYVVLPPSRHLSGSSYLFDPEHDLAHHQVLPLPPALRTLVERTTTPSSTTPTVIPRTPAPSYQDSLRKAEAALGCLAAWRCDDYGSDGAWLQVGMALRELEDRGLALWEGWSRQSERYEDGVCTAKWETFTPGGNGNGRGLGSLYEWARQDDPTRWARFLETLPRASSSGLATSATTEATGETSTQVEPAAERKPRYTLHRAVEAWEPRPPKEWLLEGLVGAGDVVLLVGEPGVGKTYWFLDLAVQVATGREFLDLATTCSPVLVVDEESGNRRLLERLERIMRGRGLPPGADIPLQYTTMTGFSFLTDPMWFTDLTMAIEETGARLVILDALADIMLGGDENMVRDAQPVFRGLKGVSEVTGATMLVVHHANRAGSYRGSSAIPGAVDLVLQLSRKEKTGPVTVESTKARDIEPVKFACRMAWDETTDSVRWGAVEQVEEEPADTETGPSYGRGERYVLTYLLGHPNGPTRREIVDAADICASGTAKNAIYNLAAMGYVVRLDKDGAGDRTRWGLTAEGREAAENLS